MDWTLFIEYFKAWEWLRLLAADRDETALREVEIDEDHYMALVRDSEASALEAMDQLEAWHQENRKHNAD